MTDARHWAYQDGNAKGRAGKTVERGLMRIGLAFAVDALTVRNTKLWLEGFDAGFEAVNSTSERTHGG